MSDTSDTPEQAQPSLSKQEFALFNQLADQMEYYHTHFREMWKVMWDACEAGRRPKGMSLTKFIDLGCRFVHHLEMHHTIEEQVLYPRLAHRLKHFDPKNGELVGQHKEIHQGMEALETYLNDCKAGRADFSLFVLKQKMETWGDVLWTHLDEEVEALGAVHMHKAFTKEEFLKIRM